MATLNKSNKYKYKKKQHPKPTSRNNSDIKSHKHTEPGDNDHLANKHTAHRVPIAWNYFINYLTRLINFYLRGVEGGGNHSGTVSRRKPESELKLKLVIFRGQGRRWSRCRSSTAIRRPWRKKRPTFPLRWAGSAPPEGWIRGGRRRATPARKSTWHRPRPSSSQSNFLQL